MHDVGGRPTTGHILRFFHQAVLAQLSLFILLSGFCCPETDPLSTF